MKKILFGVLCFLILIIGVDAKIIEFNDKNLEYALVHHEFGPPIDTNGDGKISTEEAAAYEGDGYNKVLMLEQKGIYDISGLEYFDKVDNVYLSRNHISDLEPLFGMDALKDVGLSGNRLNVSANRDFSYSYKIEQLIQKGVRPVIANQQVSWDASKINTSTPKWHVLFVIAKDMDATLELASGGTHRLDYTLSDEEVETVKLYAYEYEKTFEKLTNYKVDLVMDIYVTNQMITDINNPGWSNEQYQYALYADDIPEIASFYKDYDFSIVVGYNEEATYSSAGTASFGYGDQRGMVFASYESMIKGLVINDIPFEEWYDETRQGIFDSYSVDTFIHETTHVFEMYSTRLGIDTWEFHEALKYEEVENEFIWCDNYNRTAHYLAGNTNPVDGSQVGITDPVYNNTILNNEAGLGYIDPIENIAVKDYNGNAQLTWSQHDFATYYKVYRSVGNDYYQFVTKTTDVSYIDKDLNHGSVYKYIVVAVAVDDISISYSTYSEVVTYVIPLDKVEDFNGKIYSYKNVNLTWSKVAGSGYEIFRSTNNKDFQLIETINDPDTLVYKDTELEYNKTYYYKVRAFDASDDKLYGAYSEVASVRTYPEAPAIDVVRGDNQNIIISMTDYIPGATYKVYRATSKTGTYSLIGSTDSESYSNNGLSVGRYYYYKVRTCVENLCSAYSAYDYNYVVPKKQIFTTPTVSNSYVKLTWKKDSVSGYQVYRSTDNVNWTYIYNVKSYKTNYYTNSGLKSGETYYYRVRSYKKVNNKYFYGNYSDSIKIETKGTKVVIKNTLNTSLLLSFSNLELDNVTSYKIYKSEYSTKNYKLIANITEDTYLDGILSVGKTYYYKVRACNAYGCGMYSTVTSGLARPALVNNLEVSATRSNYVTLKWDITIGTGYQVYRSTNGTDWSKVGTVTSYKTKTFTDKTVKPNTKYYYKIRAYKTYNKKTYAGYFNEDNIVETKTLLATPTVSIKNINYDALRITSSSVSGATKYYFYRSTEKTTGYEQIAELENGRVYDDAALETGKTYYYRVRACNEEECSSYSSIYYIKVVPVAPVVTLTTTSRKVTVKYNAVEGADGYVIYRATSKNGRYTRVRTTKNLSYVNSTTRGRTYYYKVAAYKIVDGKYVYSGYSSIKYIKSK